MFTSLISNLLSIWFSFLLPCYETWKTLAHKPTSEQELEKWAMYWCIMGAFVAFEYVAEWLVSWLPFYWESKILFLLFLSLPQTQGSTWLYTTYVHPYLAQNEAKIDAGIVAAKANMLAFLQKHLSAIYQGAVSAAIQASTAGQAQPGTANPLDVAKGMLSAFAPSLLQGPGQMHHRPVPSTAESFASIHSVESSSDDSAPPSSYSSEATGYNF